jgi:hypothetical protein
MRLRSNLAMAIIHFAIAAAALAMLVLGGCAHQPTPFHHTIPLGDVTVHIVALPEQLPPVAGVDQQRMRGAAYRNGHIWVVGEVIDGKLVAHEQALAHEIEHLLNWRDPEKYQHPHRR